MKLLPAVIVILASVSVIYADEPTVPTPPPEIQPAMQKCDEALKQAELAYRKAVVAAKKDLLKEVQTQLQAAMKAGKVESVKALDAMKTDLEAEIAFLDFKGAIVKVDARGWLKIGPVKKGQTYRFEAKGTWSMLAGDPKSTCNADGLERTHGSGKLGALAARINGKTILLGKAATIQIPEDGVLELGPNDDILDDNSGFLTVRVEAVSH